MSIKIGDVFPTTKGGDCVVTELYDNGKVLVEFCDSGRYTTEVYVANLKNGEVLNRFLPKWFDVGFLGNAVISKENIKPGHMWQNMLSRCYYSKNGIVYPDTKVSENWHSFENFLAWYSEEIKYVNWPGRVFLDKDIIGDSTLYSSETCCLVPSKINTIMASPRGGKYLPGAEKLPSGRYRGVQGYKSRTMLFQTEIEAHIAYVDFKLQKIRDYAEEYKDKMNPVVYEVLITKDFRSKFIKV